MITIWMYESNWVPKPGSSADGEEMIKVFDYCALLNKDTGNWWATMAEIVTRSRWPHNWRFRGHMKISDYTKEK